MRFATIASQRPLQASKRLSEPQLACKLPTPSALTQTLSELGSLSPQECAELNLALEVVRREFEPLMGFESPFDLQITTQIQVMGEYVSGTSDQPFILLNPVAILQYARSFQSSFYTEVLMTLVHELARVKQDLAGRLDGSEDIETEAELFAYNWVCYNQISLDLLSPWEESRF